jgi:hypothetical protein
VDGGWRGGETGGGETAVGSRGRGKSAAATASSGRRGPNVVGPWFGPGGWRVGPAVLIFFELSKST